MVVGEDGRGGVGRHPGGEQVLRRARDRVGRVVDVRDPVAVLVGGHAVDHLGGRVDRRAAPGVARRAADADLHRAGRAEGVRVAVHSRQGGLPVVAFHRADAGQDRPRHAVLLADLPVPEEIGGRDPLGPGGGRGLPDNARLLAGAPGAGREEQVRADQHRHREQGEQHQASDHDDADDEDPGRPGRSGRRLGYRPEREHAGHELPALAGSMSLTCHWPAEPVTVIAY